MTEARALACVYAALFLLACSYCGKDLQPIEAVPRAAATGNPPDAGQDSAQPLRGQSAVTSRPGAQRMQRLCDASCTAPETCSSQGICVPGAWFCGPSYYDAGADDGCDCDCGAPDPDCELTATVAHWCYNAGKAQEVLGCGECMPPGAEGRDSDTSE